MISNSNSRIIWYRRRHEQILQIEAEHEKLNGSKTGRSKRLPTVPNMGEKKFLAAQDIYVQHCPTEHMLADFFTKPLQGSLFRKFREVILEQKHMDLLKQSKPTPSQERV
jgi:hypothetical protein